MLLAPRISEQFVLELPQGSDGGSISLQAAESEDHEKGQFEACFCVRARLRPCRKSAKSTRALA